MNKFNDELDRLIRRNGKQPTQKDKWKAFWRLWRICNRVSKNHSCFILPAAETAFHWLMEDNWQWVKLASAPNDKLTLPLNSIPIIIRKLWVQSDKRKRLLAKEINYAKKQGLILDQERNKIIAEVIRKNGLEVTSDEIDKIRSNACSKIRKCLITSGWNVKDIPVSDEGIILLLNKYERLLT